MRTCIAFAFALIISVFVVFSVRSSNAWRIQGCDGVFTTDDSAPELVKQLFPFAKRHFEKIVEINIDQYDSSLCEVSNFGQFSHLESLHVDSNNLTDAIVSSLSAHPDLRIISLGSSRVSDHSMRAISRIGSVQQIYLARASVTWRGLAELVKLTNLNALSLQDIPLDKKGVSEINKMGGIRLLYLYRCDLDNEKVMRLDVSRLTHLSLNGAKISMIPEFGIKRTHISEKIASGFDDSTDYQGGTIGENARLLSLNLADTEVSDQSITMIKRCTRLMTLDISGTRITSEGYRRLKADLPDCYIEF